MILDNNNIQVDIKVTNRYRKWLSTLLINNTLELKCIMLGDSDIDYELGDSVNGSRILNSPYNPEAIKYPLIYNGLGNGVKGIISTFVRYVDENGDVSSYYNYPLSTTLSIGRIPPTLVNGLDIDTVDFTNDRMGIIFFFQSLLDYYRTDEGVQQRLNENYEIKVKFNNSEIVPNNWQVIRDDLNHSLLISKTNINVTTPTTYSGEIIITGVITKIGRAHV